MGEDVVQVVAGASCIICVAPIIIAAVMLRLAISLERFLLSRSLLLWLLPITILLKADRHNDSNGNQHNGGYR